MMTEITIHPAQLADAPALAELANQHTYRQLNEEARQGGFLTGSFSAPAFQAMLSSVPGQVAEHNGELAGFIINSRLSPERYPPLVQEIMTLLPHLSYQQRALTTYQWFFYGPVLVAPAYRGHGLLQQLFQENCRTLAGQFELGIAFIAADNTASLRLHTHKLGLKVVGQCLHQGAAYEILVFPVGQAGASQV
jgi:hypothetical protein